MAVPDPAADTCVVAPLPTVYLKAGRSRLGGDLMDYLVQIGGTLISWFALMFISTNLLGGLVRGLVANPEADERASENEVLTHEIRRSERNTNIFFAILIAVFLTILYYFWNFGLVAAGLMLLVSRVPDLIWELQSRKKLELGDVRKPRFSLTTTLLSWASIPVVWYSIYQM